MYCALLLSHQIRAAVHFALQKLGNPSVQGYQPAGRKPKNIPPLDLAALQMNGIDLEQLKVSLNKLAPLITPAAIGKRNDTAHPLNDPNVFLLDSLELATNAPLAERSAELHHHMLVFEFVRRANVEMDLAHHEAAIDAAWRSLEKEQTE